MAETAYEYFTDEISATVSTNEKRVITRIKKLADKYPEEVSVVFTPDRNSGVMVAKIPRKWVKLPAPPRAGREMSDEERQAAAERLKALRKCHELDAKIAGNRADG